MEDVGSSAVAWVGAITGTTALFWQIFREAVAHRRKYSDLVAVIPHVSELFVENPLDPFVHYAHVRNTGSQPIYDVIARFYCSSPDATSVRHEELIGPNGNETLTAGDAFEKKVSGAVGTTVTVTYTDAAGRRWAVYPSGRTHRHRDGWIGRWVDRLEARRSFKRRWDRWSGYKR